MILFVLAALVALGFVLSEGLGALGGPDLDISLIVGAALLVCGSLAAGLLSAVGRNGEP